MTPERKGPGLRFDKGDEAKPTKAKGRPAGAWKKASARMVAESAVQPEAAPVREGAAPYVPDVPEASPAGEAPRPAGADTGPEAPPADGEPRQAEGGAAPDTEPGGLGQNVPKYRQHSRAESASGQSVHRGKFRQDSQQARPSDRLHHDEGGGSGPAGPAAGGPGAGGGDPPKT